MSSSVLTRKATARELDIKLNAALKELKQSKATCEQLLRERDDSEYEVQQVVAKNTELKRELADLDVMYTDVEEQRDRLLESVSKLQQCWDVHERALKRVDELEYELAASHEFVRQLQEQIERQEAENTQRLYNEIMPATIVSKTRPAIGLEAEDSPKDTVYESPLLHFQSRNKFKKYVKLNRFIRRSKRLYKQHHSIHKTKRICKDRIRILGELKTCNAELQHSRYAYVTDTSGLREEINRLECSLSELTSKYQLCQNQISEHILAANELVDLCTFNEQRVNSLLARDHLDGALQTEVNHKPASPRSADICAIPKIDEKNCYKNVNETLVFTDRIGKGLGKLLYNNIPNSCVVNNCMPNASFKQVVDKIMLTQVSKQSTIVILLSDGSDTRYSDVKTGFDSLSKLGAKNIIIGAFPYSASLNNSNKQLYRLNKLLFKMTSRHSDVLFFDTNSVISDYRFNRDKLAKSLACFINSVFGNNSPSPAPVRTTPSSANVSLNDLQRQ